MFNNTYTLTTAKAKLSAIISKIEHERKRVFITRRGRNVAVIIPFENYELHERGKRGGLISAKGALADLDELDDFVDHIYEEREREIDREVTI